MKTLSLPALSLPTNYAAWLLPTLLVGSAFAEQVVFTELMYNPRDGKPEFLEIRNQTSNRYDIAKWNLIGGVDYTFPDFNPGNPQAHFLKEFETILLSSADPATTRTAYPNIPPTTRIYGPWVGNLDNDGESITLVDAAKTKFCELSYGDGAKWPLAADGAGHSLIVVNGNRAIDDFRNWQLGGRLHGTPGSSELPVTEVPTSSPSVDFRSTTVVDYNATWEWAVPTADPYVGTAPRWMDPGFDWTTFPLSVTLGTATTNPARGSGKGILGFKNNGTAYPRQPGQDTDGLTGLGTTPASEGLRTLLPRFGNGSATGQWMVYLVRTTFNWTGSTNNLSFSGDIFNDDGVIFYLNGQRLGAPIGMAETGAWNRAATRTQTTAAEETAAISGAVPADAINGGSLLKVGTNVLAAAVHQVNGTSSDVAHSLRLKLTGGSTPEVVINEVKPGAAGGGFVEFYNTSAANIDLQGWYLTDTPGNYTKHQISGSLVVPAGGFATVGFAESSLAVSSSTTVYLIRPDGLTPEFGIVASIPLDGRTLGQRPAGSGSWYQFGQGTPGTGNVSDPSLRNIRISEVAFTATGRAQQVEFANMGGTNVALTASGIASRVDLADRVALTGSVGPNGYLSVPVDFPTPLNGVLNLYMIDPAGNVIESVRVPKAAVTVTSNSQRLPLDGPTWYKNAGAGTLGTTNSPTRNAGVVISEIMAHPPSRHDDGEFIELSNSSAQDISIAGWSFADGVNFLFPVGASIPAGGRVVVVKDVNYMLTNYTNLTPSMVFGPYEGTLQNGGELLVLQDATGNEADRVDYKFGGEWPAKASAEGSSLELVHLDMDNSRGSAWRDSLEANKSTFAPYSATGIYRQLRGTPNASPTVAASVAAMHELLVNLVSDGHVILRNIRLEKSTALGTNMIPTGDATSHTGNGNTGFLCTGTHHRSDTLPDGFHLISTGSGDTKNNKAEVDIIGLVPGDNLTLTFEARWVSGIPLLVCQTWDRSFGQVFRLPIPGNLGTPGAINSVAEVAAIPTVDQVRHSPAVPNSTAAVTVTARIASAAPLASVQLIERLDSVANNGAWTTRPMMDDGVNPDALANDGVYTASVPARPDTTITQFYVRANTAAGAFNEYPRSGITTPGMWIVDNTPPTATPGLLAQRYVVSRFDRQALNSALGFTSTYDWNFPRMSNHGFNTTMIMNESEVFYACEMRKGGSPWTRDGSNAMGRIRYRTPGDNVWRNRSKSGIDNDAQGASRFHNRTVRYMLYLFGYPVPDSEFVQKIVNEDAPNLGDDQEQTDSDFFDRAYGGGGELHEIDDAWYIYDIQNTVGTEDPRVDAGSVTGRWMPLDWSGQPAWPGVTSPIFWHGNWPIRFPEERYDYNSLSSFVVTAYNNGSAPGTGGILGTPSERDWWTRMDQMLDIERTAIYAVVRGYIGDWDNFTYNRGKNGFLYRRPTDGKYELHHWDSDLGFQDGYRTGAFLGGAGGTGWTNLSNHPAFRRRMMIYLQELLNRYTLNSTRMNAYLDSINYQSTNPDALAPFKTTLFDYRTWFSTRESTARTFIQNAGGLNPILNHTARAFIIGTVSNLTVNTPTFEIRGTAPISVDRVVIDGHPEATFRWNPTSTDVGEWLITGIKLAAGTNNLTVRGLTLAGVEAASLPFVVNFSGNGPPVASFTITPGNNHFELNERVALDATGSFDPEGQPLNYAWTITPTNGVTQIPSTASKLEAIFTIPGRFTVKLTVTDAAGQISELTKEVSSFATADFQPFADGAPLPAGLTVQNLEYRDNFSNTPWYSVEDDTGRLLVHVMNGTATPLANPTFTHPLITRPLPTNADWVLETDLELQTREFGTFQTGLWLEMNEAGTTTRYAFAYDGGSGTTNASLMLLRATTGAYSTLSTTPLNFGSGNFRLRLSKVGNQLIPYAINGNVTLTPPAYTLPADSTAVRGGVFVATNPVSTGIAPNNVLTNPEVRVAFDYLLVGDPAKTHPALSALRILKVHYNPVFGPEYLELKNVSNQALDLTGVKFELGAPFGEYVFSGMTLAPGEHLVLTSDEATFRNVYGPLARLGIPWSGGNLSNGGETIMLRDPLGNSVHHFAYGDSLTPNWPTTPDGEGPALEVINVNGDYNLPSNWRAATAAAVPGLSQDTDGDGMPDNLEARFGTNPNNKNSLPIAGYTQGAGGARNISFPAVNGRSYAIERSTDLENWEITATVTVTSNNGVYADPEFPTTEHAYYRVIPLP